MTSSLTIDAATLTAALSAYGITAHVATVDGAPYVHLDCKSAQVALGDFSVRGRITIGPVTIAVDQLTWDGQKLTAMWKVVAKP
jgi:hypothetical protein